MIRQVSTDQIGDLNQLILGDNEGVMFVKFVLLRQPTLTSGESATKIAEAPAAILLGDLGEMKAQLSAWLDEAMNSYRVKNA